MAAADPPAVMSRLITGYWASQAVYVAAKLRLADLVKDGPRAPVDLAAATGAHPEALSRLLRALASLGVFAEDGSGKFASTPLAECLRGDVPGSQHALAVMNGEEHYRAFGDLLYSVRTGRPAFDHLFGQPVFDHLAGHPEQAKVFDAAMVGVHGAETAAMVEAYDFSGLGTLVDVGGGNGSLLVEVLKRNPRLQGVLYDRADVVERARAALATAGVADRCRAVAGNFFEAVPPGGDAYLMRHIIHDWDDERSLKVLTNCRRALGPGGKVLVVEMVIAPGNAPGFGKLLDLTMLVIPGGKERTEPEYRALFTRAGLRLTRVVPTRSEVSVIEAEAA